MRNTLLISSLLFSFSCQELREEKKQLIDIKKCTSTISIDKYGIGTKFYSNPDTIKLNSASFLVVSLYSCEGEMDFKEFNIDSGLVLEGHYKAANELTKAVTESINPMDGTSTFDSTNHYVPTKIGVWSIYNKNGEIIKTENYK